MRFMCTAVGEASCLMSSEKNEWNTACSVLDCGADNGNVCLEALYWCNKMISVDIDLFPP